MFQVLFLKRRTPHFQPLAFFVIQSHLVVIVLCALQHTSKILKPWVHFYFPNVALGITVVSVLQNTRGSTLGRERTHFTEKKSVWSKSLEFSRKFKRNGVSFNDLWRVLWLRNGQLNPRTCTKIHIPTVVQEGGLMEPLPRVFHMLQYFETILPSVESLRSSQQDEVYYFYGWWRC